MQLQLFHATPVTLVLWMCISFSVGGPLSGVTPTVVLPAKFVKSSMDASRSNTGETNDANDEIGRGTEPIKSPGSSGVHFYRLPPSPANLLKPDGFQFYTYNDRGDMITRQMTMQEIQALIAGGGPGHSNTEIQGPQKVEDILTGGKKVIDVVEKVQNVLKSAMDKPLSTLSGSHLTIPEKANVEWSNILPAILAGDKYGNKVDENNHVEAATLKPMSTLAVQNVSFSESKEGNASGTVGSTVFENVTKGTVLNEETTEQTESDGTRAESSTVKFETATSPYTEKLMIPVAVVTTERNTEQVTQHTTHSYSFHTITEVVPSLENVLGEHYSRGPEGLTTVANVDTRSTTITSSVESTGNSGDDMEFASTTSNILLGETQRKPIGDNDASIEEHNVSSKTQTSSLSESSKLEPSSTMPSHRTTTADSLAATFVTETTTIDHDAVTKSTGTPPTQQFKPLPLESLVNSLSSAIGQASEDDATPVSVVSPDLEWTHGDTDNGERSNGTEVITSPPTNQRDEENPAKANDTFGSPVQNSFAGTTIDVAIDEQQSSTESWTKSAVSNSVSSDESSLNRTETTTGMDPSEITRTTLNPSGSSETNFTTNNWNFSKPVEMIDSILRTVSTDAVATVTESLTIPNNLTEGFSINTLASALIAGFEAIDSDRTQIALNDTATTQSSTEINWTVAGTAFNTISSAAANESIGNADRTNGTDSAKKNEDRYTFTSTAKEELTDSITQFSNSVEEAASLETTDRAVPLTRTNIETTQSKSEPTRVAEQTTAKTFAATALVDNMLNAGATTLNSIEEGGAMNRNTEAISSWSTESVNLDATDKFGTAVTVAVTPDSSPMPERDSQVVLQKEGENSGTYGNDTAELSPAGHNQHRNETIESFDATRTYPNDTESTAASNISTEYDTTESSTAKRGGTDETSVENDRITSTTHESTVSTNAPTATEVLGGKNESQDQVKEKLNERESTTPQSNSNSTDTETNPHHVWQEISLQETKPTAPTRLAPGSKESAEPQPSTVTTQMEVQLEPGSATETGSTVDLDALKGTGGLDSSTRNASADIANFSQLCNELAMKFWIATNKGLSTGRSLALSPFGMISLLSMIFLGARGSTSDEMNEILGLDNVATFNPHLVFQNITDTVSLARQQGIANAAFVRELFADKAKVRKLLPFYKEQAQQFYEGLVAEVNFATISDLVRRRTNLLVRKQTGGRIKDFAKNNAVTLRSPLAAISANVFQTDCNTSSTSTTGRDGELYFAVSSAHRSRKLIPVPATVWRSNVLAGYEPSLDATAIALGGVERLVSTIFLLPGQQGHVAPGDTLDRLEQRLAKGAFRDGSWQKILKVLIPRPGLDAQIPKFSHRSVVNATAALKRMGLDQLFSKQADFKGINGIGNRLFLSDVLQMNLFSTCGDESIANGRHHVEIYPAGPSLRNSRNFEHGRGPNDEGKEYRGNPSKWATRAAERAEAKPRLKLDQPFLYFVRHNPTGIILHMGRFNPRLL